MNQHCRLLFYSKESKTETYTNKTLRNGELRVQFRVSVYPMSLLILYNCTYNTDVNYFVKW